MRFSIVVPIYNDGYLARDLCVEVQGVMAAWLDKTDISSDVELIFVNDGSRDASVQELRMVVDEFSFVSLIDLSRNFGQHAAIACGLMHAKGDVVVRMNVDMQDHPMFIPKLLEHLEENNLDLVVGQYDVRKSPWLDRLTSDAYFYCFKWLTGFSIPKNTSPLRAMSRRFVNAYNGLTEKTRFPQGLDVWLGFDHGTVPIEHREREDGKSSYTFIKRLALAFDGILYFSDRPIKLVAGAGVAVSVLGFLLGLVLVVSKLMGVEYLPGYASLASMGLIALGLQLFSIGLVGLYIAKIFVEAKDRPLYLVKDHYNKHELQE